MQNTYRQTQNNFQGANNVDKTISAWVAGVEVKGMRVISSRSKGKCDASGQWFDPGTQIAYKPANSLTKEEIAAIFPAGQKVWPVTVIWPMDPSVEAANKRAEAAGSVNHGYELNEYQQNIVEDFINGGDACGGPHILVRALAGCTKTSTEIALVRELHGRGLARGLFIQYLAFNTDIKSEVKAKVDAENLPLKVDTTHGFCFKSLVRKFNGLREMQKRNRSPQKGTTFHRTLFLECLCDDLRITYDNFSSVRNLGEYKIAPQVIELVGYLKNNAIFPERKEKGYVFSDESIRQIDDLFDEYDMEIPDFWDIPRSEWPTRFNAEDYDEVRAAIVSYAARIAAKSIPMPNEEMNDVCFDDMLYVTMYLVGKGEMSLNQPDIVLTDESQDFNQCQLLLLEHLASRK